MPDRIRTFPLAAGARAAQLTAGSIPGPEGEAQLAQLAAGVDRRLDEQFAGASLGVGELAWELAWITDEMAEEDRAALFVLAACVLASWRQGSTRLPLDTPFQMMAEVLGLPDELVARARELAATERDSGLIGSAGTRAPLVIDGNAATTGRLWHEEQSIARALAARLAAGPQDAMTAPVDAAGRPFAVITGGPGTGKTTAARAIVEELVAQGVPARRIALAAPTGKAAHQLLRSLGGTIQSLGVQPPMTLHRLLGVAQEGGRTRHHRGNPLDVRALIVDEASMVDHWLADRLLEALPAEASLTLLGDPMQLPAVESGAMLRDLVALGAGIFELRHSYRLDAATSSGAAIVRAARNVQEGAPPDELGECRSPRDLPGEGTWLLPLARSEGRLGEQLDERLDEMLDAWSARPGVTQVLTITRVGPRGSNTLNRQMHARHARSRGWSTTAPFLPGEPVIVTRNDAARRLSNGDTGVVVQDDDHDGLFVELDTTDGRKTLPVGALRGSLELAHAITVHKSQGSEYEEALLVLPAADMPLLSREILYTGMTRASRTLVIAGDPELLAVGAARPAERYTGLVEALETQLGVAGVD